MLNILQLFFFVDVLHHINVIFKFQEYCFEVGDYDVLLTDNEGVICPLLEETLLSY